MPDEPDEPWEVYLAREMANFTPLSPEHQRQINRFVRDDMPIKTEEEQRGNFAFGLWRHRQRQLREKDDQRKRERRKPQP